jgi:hypothetical protein
MDPDLRQDDGKRLAAATYGITPFKEGSSCTVLFGGMIG